MKLLKEKIKSWLDIDVAARTVASIVDKQAHLITNIINDLKKQKESWAILSDSNLKYDRIIRSLEEQVEYLLLDKKQRDSIRPKLSADEYLAAFAPKRKPGRPKQMKA